MRKQIKVLKDKSKISFIFIFSSIPDISNGRNNTYNYYEVDKFGLTLNQLKDVTNKVSGGRTTNNARPSSGYSYNRTYTYQDYSPYHLYFKTNKKIPNYRMYL